MKTNLFLVVVFFIVTASTFCKKSTSVHEMLIGNWKIDSIQLRMSINNQIVYQTIHKPSADYYDFRTNNKLYRRWMNNHDTVPFSLVSLNGRSIVQYPYYGADTIVEITNRYLILKAPQGSDSKIFLSK